MESIRHIYRIGTGPSSSHTMAPRKAAQTFLKRHPKAAAFRVTLYGSLAATGRGHLTDKALYDVFRDRPMELLWLPDEQLPLHPNGMLFEALSASRDIENRWQVYSVGGGALLDADHPDENRSCYPLHTLEEILKHTTDSGESLWEYVLNHEGTDFPDHLAEVWDVMSTAIRNGLENAGVIPGGLGLGRKAIYSIARPVSTAIILKTMPGSGPTPWLCRKKMRRAASSSPPRPVEPAVHCLRSCATCRKPCHAAMRISSALLPQRV